MDSARHCDVTNVTLHVTLAENKEEQVGNNEQDIHDDQTPPHETGPQSSVEVDRGDQKNDALYRGNDASKVIAIPIRDWTLKDEIGERKKVIWNINLTSLF